VADGSYEAVRVVTQNTQPVAPLFPATWTDDNAVGTITWSNPSNVNASDGSYATAAVGTSHYLKGVNVGENIPANATILGVLVEIERSVGA